MDRLHALDAAFGPMQRGGGPLHVASLLVLDGPAPAWDEWLDALDTLVSRVPAHRARVVRMPAELGRPVWQAAPGLDVGDHARHVVVAGELDEAALRACAARESETPLDAGRPPWRVTLVTGECPSWAIVVCVGHELVDGVAGIALLRSLLDGAPPSGLLDPQQGPVMGRALASGAGHLLSAPYRVGYAVGSFVREPGARDGLDRVRAGLREVTHADLAPTPFSGRLCGRRRWGSVVRPAAGLRAAAERAGCTIDDVYLAALAAAYREGLHGSGPPGRGAVRLLVPVSTRTSGDAHRPGTMVGAFFVDLPVELDDPVARLDAVVRQTRRAKSQDVAAATEALLRAGDHVPAPLLAVAARRYAARGQRRVNACATDVRGPAAPLSLLGRRVVSMAPVVPVALDVRLTCALLSYAGAATVGVTADACGPDLDAFLAALGRGFDELISG